MMRMFDQVIQRALILAAVFTGVPLLCASCIGLLVSFIQSATQVQEQSVVFLIKLAVLSLVIGFGWNWAFAQLSSTTQAMFSVLSAAGTL